MFMTRMGLGCQKAVASIVISILPNGQYIRAVGRTKPKITAGTRVWLFEGEMERPEVVEVLELVNVKRR
jgi:hypothetical protein